ncbi:hypothetical protein V1639_12420 [Pseudarthrobacter sp. J75]|uniref:hypothetical protein n=1 Tax=unclassified Pseudarthrobacter TaxID=2647000 RepID=UPI002E81C55D|nr:MULTISPECIES: hypothetical protein [unclassified Pseudarthrobacter]MEE2523140.1 hypothetical protein [Pseudarthrobacter sp. J47]MEE2529824.1 hypothetical protein [Pseudarthrobacter sp. J75]MEE2569141.1 hypothetical protein [Pseudarthrobacter sp. J64]
MSSPHFEAFLAEATREEPDVEAGLSRDELYGVYISWCLMNNEEARPATALWAALRAQGTVPDSNRLVMTGPAAADYIIAGAPELPDVLDDPFLAPELLLAEPVLQVS